MHKVKGWHITGFLMIVVIGVIGFGSYVAKNALNDNHFCTLVGCFNHISVVIVTPLPDSYDVEVWYGDDYIKFRCENKQLVTTDAIGMPNERNFGQDFTEFCAEQRMSSEDTVDKFTLKITWVDGSYEETVRPDYSVNQPNGPDCEPTCRTANIQLDLDEAN